MEKQVSLKDLPSQGTRAMDVFEFYDQISFDEISKLLTQLVSLWEENRGQAPSGVGQIEVNLLRDYRSKIIARDSVFEADTDLLRRARIFRLDQTNYVIDSLEGQEDRAWNYAILMSGKKPRFWRNLPRDYYEDDLIKSFYSDKSIQELLEYMQSVIDEWHMHWHDPIRDQSVASVELPLIQAFKNIATESDIEKHKDILDEFQICDDRRAVKMAREMLGQEPLEF